MKPLPMIPETPEIPSDAPRGESVEGLVCLDQPVFSVQYHPEASPGPHDSAYLFEEFGQLMEKTHG